MKRGRVMSIRVCNNTNNNDHPHSTMRSSQRGTGDENAVSDGENSAHNIYRMHRHSLHQVTLAQHQSPVVLEDLEECGSREG